MTSTNAGKQSQDISAKAEQCKLLEEENAIAIRQLHDVQQDLETRLTEYKRQYSKIKWLRKERDSSTKKIADIEKKLDELRRDNSELRDALDEQIKETNDVRQKMLAYSSKVNWLRAVASKHRRRTRELRYELRKKHTLLQDLRISHRESVVELELARNQIRHLEYRRLSRYTKLFRIIRERFHQRRSSVADDLGGEGS